MRGRIRAPAAVVCPIPRRLIAAALVCSVFVCRCLSAGGACPCARGPAASAVPVADFQHGTRVRRETGDSAGGPELQRERYEADAKLIPNCGNPVTEKAAAVVAPDGESARTLA
jgi:hypothetical protein